MDPSHNVYSLRAKDAVVRGKARLINVSALWGEINDFAEAWIQPKPGDEAAVVAALAEAVDGKNAAASRDLLSPEAQAAFDKAVAILQAAKTEAGQPFTAIAGLSNFGATATGAIVGSLANIAVSLAGADAPKALLVLPQEANVWGMRDVGGSPELLPGHRAAGDDAARQEMRRLWGAEIPSNVGLTIDRMAGLKALVVLNDNPLMLAPDRAASEQLFSALDFLAVIDSVPTDTANLAHALLPDAGYWAKEGTTTSADRRVLRLNQAHQPRGEAQQGWRILSELGVHLAGALKSGEIHIHYTSAAEIMDEIAEVVPLYRNAGYREIDSGQQQYIDGLGPRSAVHVTVHTAVASNSHGGAFTLSTSRGLYTSYEAAATHSKEADRLHREDSLKMNPADAAALGLASGDVVTVHNARSSVAAPVEITAAVQPKMLWIASFYDAGAPAALFAADSPVASVEVSRA